MRKNLIFSILLLTAFLPVWGIADIYNIPESEKIKYNNNDNKVVSVEEERKTTQPFVIQQNKNGNDTIEKETSTDKTIKKELINDKFLKASKSISF